MSNPIFLQKWTYSDEFLGWYLAEWLERLTANVKTKVATALDSIPAPSDKAKSEGRQMRQCWIKYIKTKKIPLLNDFFNISFKGRLRIRYFESGFGSARTRFKTLGFSILWSWTSEGAYLGKWGDDKRNILGLLFQYQDRRCLLKYKD